MVATQLIFNLHLKKILWSNRNICTNSSRVCKISLDCTDYLIEEPQPFNKSFYSHKYNHAALRYEIAVALYSSNIVWASGPHIPGMKTDITIYRESLKHILIANNEMTYADSGYQGEQKTIQEKGRGSVEERNIATRARARHETINRRLKEWKSLSTQFRHNKGYDIRNHGLVFDAVLVLTQLSVAHNKSLFEL